MTRISGWVMLASVFLFFVDFGARAEPPESAFKVLKKIPVGGEGGWDYLTMDALGRRLYIARSNRVTVVDVDEGKVVGEVANTPGIHGVALDLKRKKGYTSNGGDATVTIFDLETLKELARPKVGTRPDAIIYDPVSDRVFTFNAGSKDATAISAESGNVDGTIKLDGKPEFAVADEKGQVFVNLEDKSEVVAFDAKKLTVLNRWPLAPGKNPSGLSMDRTKRRLFATCRNEMMVVMDADSGKVLDTPAIGKGTDASAFDPGTGLAYSSNGDGTLTVVEEQPADHYRVAANVKTQDGARTMALDTKTHNIYLVTSRFKPAVAGERRRAQEPDSFEILVVGK
jgi:DNA-binding beta-propeller fold protein YncE